MSTGVTIGKNLSTGMTTITFDSTGRMVQFTPEESKDFYNRMELFKIEGKLSKNSIASRSIVLLQKISNLFGIEDMDGVMDILEMDSTKSLLKDAIANHLIEEIKEEIKEDKDKKDMNVIDNPFSLYMDSDNITRNDLIRAINTSNAVKEILSIAISDISELVLSFKDDDKNLEAIYKIASSQIRNYYEQKVGLSDTSSRESIGIYIQKKLEEDSVQNSRAEEIADYFLDFL